MWKCKTGVKLCISLGLLENDTAGCNWVNRVIHGRDGQSYCQILSFEIKPDPLLTSAVPRGIWAPAILIAVPPGWQLMMAWLVCTPNRGQWHGQQSGNELEIEGVFFMMEVDTGWHRLNGKCCFGWKAVTSCFAILYLWSSVDAQRRYLASGSSWGSAGRRWCSSWLGRGAGFIPRCPQNYSDSLRRSLGQTVCEFSHDIHDLQPRPGMGLLGHGRQMGYPLVI